MARIDPHSFADDLQPRTRHVHLQLAVDFPRRVLTGEARLDLAGPVEAAGTTFDLDTRGLRLSSVTSLPGRAAVPHVLADEDAICGQRLRLTLPAGAESVVVAYETSPEA